MGNLMKTIKSVGTVALLQLLSHHCNGVSLSALCGPYEDEEVCLCEVDGVIHYDCDLCGDDKKKDQSIPSFYPDDMPGTMINFNAPVIINIYNNDCCNDDCDSNCDEFEPEPEEPEVCIGEFSDDLHPGVQEVLKNVEREGACIGLLHWGKENEISEAGILAELQNEELNITDHCDQ